MERLQELEKEITEMRKKMYERENELYELKKKWIPNSQVNSIQPQYQPQNYQYQEQDVNIFNKLHFGDKLPRWAIERYSRQILLSDIGVTGQEKICRARVLVVGAGGLGCPAASYLAGAGVGEIGIVDYDTVDVTNIHRQLLHSEQDQYMNKVESAANALRRINSRITITPYHLQLDSTNVLDILSKYDLVLDCTDNVPTRYLLNDSCVLLKIPLISGSALKMEGQLTIYVYRPNKYLYETDSTSSSGPCYRCLFPSPPPPETVGSCSAHGVVGPVPGVIGTLQALEAIKYIVGKTAKSLLVGRMLLFDGDDCTFRTVKLRPKSTSCAACSDSPTITQLLDYESFCRTTTKEKNKEDAKRKAQLRKEERQKRMAGQCYFGFRKTKMAGDREKWIQDVPKSSRKLGPTCKSELCAKGVNRLCAAITEERRRDIFQEFWNRMDWRTKRAYVRALVDTIPPKRRRLKHKGDVSRKGDSKLYHLLNGDKRIPVCRVMFLNTLGIKEAMVRSWLQTTDHLATRTKRKPLKSQNVDAYIDSLPTSPPKCSLCRSYTSLTYLTDIKNQHQLYNRYVEDMRRAGVTPASRKTFTKVFTAKNIRIFKPKKEGDACDLRAEHNVETTQQTYQSLEPVHTQGIDNFEQW